MTMSVGRPQTFMQDSECTLSVHALLSIYLLLADCSFAFSCSMIDKLTYLGMKLQLQLLILCTYAHLRSQNYEYNERNLSMSAVSPLCC